jgi:hypothetical protein
VGTDGVDVLVTFNTLTAFVGAQGSSDRITAGNINGLVDWQTKGGSGNDTIIYQNDVIGGRTNGNAGSDTINVFANVVGDAAIFGGQNNDTISVGNVANSRINGNLGADNISGDDLLQASIFGGQQNDVIDFFGDLQLSVVGGNLGDDTIVLGAFASGAGSSVFETTVLGGEGADFINAGGVAGTGGGLTIEGGAGNDTIVGSDRDDVIGGGAGDDQVWGDGGADTMSGNGGANIFGYGYGVAGAGTGIDAAAAESITGSATDPTATDIITDWGTSDTLGIDDVTGFSVGATFDTLKNAMASGGNATEVKLVAVGSDAAGYTAFALIYGTGAAAAAGAIQLGSANVYTSANYVNVVTAAQVVDPI